MNIQKRFFAGLLIFAVLVAGGNCFAVSAATDINGFTISSFEVDYYLSRDDKKVSQLTTVEQIVAEFPDIDQNHGIMRAIPKQYDGHSVELKIVSVLDDSGRAMPYSTSSANDNLVLKIGDANKYVHGKNLYRIEYTSQNVIKDFGDHQEFYWDVNGDQWQQTANQVVGRVHLLGDVGDSLQTEKRCYAGKLNSKDTNCQVKTEQSNAQIIIKAERQLQAKETLTFVLGFNKDTFAAYAMPWGKLLGWALLIIFVFVLPMPLTAIFMWKKWRKFGRDMRGKGTIVPMYLPPAGVGVQGSGVVLKEEFNAKFISAQIIDLAVRHYLKIYEIEKTGLLKSGKSYEIELVRDWTDLQSEEQATVKLLFGEEPKIGESKTIQELSTKIYKDAQELGKTVVAQIVLNNYFVRDPEKAKRPYMIAGSILMGISFFSLPFLAAFLGSGLILLIGSRAMPARSLKGVELRDYLLGLEMYMKVAESERLKILQSPNGSLTEKIPIDTSDKRQLVKLYERLLPYAMLFGIEEDWAKEFAGLYDQSPDWYAGSGSFQPMLFAASMHSFNTATATSFSPPSNSSSSGMGGGGFSGGGGGGGGGGGW